MSRKLVIVGAGSWGTALASLAAPQSTTMIWARSAATADEIEFRHTNERYLPGLGLSTQLGATSSLAVALEGADAILMAVPSHGTRAVLEQAAPMIATGTPVFSLSKGIEADSMLRMSQIIAAVVPHATPGVLTGPNLAAEIAQGQPAACIVASEEESAAELVQSMLHSATLRVYTSTDVIGCEIAGATKNVLAIAAGIATGFGFGDNTRSALITRGLAEMGRLGITMGGQTLTFGTARLASPWARVETCLRSSSPCTWLPRG